jgi:hypothetical protein
MPAGPALTFSEVGSLRSRATCWALMLLVSLLRKTQATPQEREKLLLARYGFQESPDRPRPIPQQFTSDGKGNLATNCLTCHGGPVAGKVVLGLGNSLIDLATFEEDLLRMYVAKGITPPPPPKAAVQTPQAPVRGLNNAWGGATALMLVRDRDLNLMDIRQFAPPTPAQLDIPLKTPPYWVSKKKTRYYYDAFIAKSHRDIMQFTFAYTMAPQQIFAQEAVFKDIYAWINAVSAPKYPFPVDRALARRGLASSSRIVPPVTALTGRAGATPSAWSRSRRSAPIRLGRAISRSRSSNISAPAGLANTVRRRSTLRPGAMSPLRSRHLGECALPA